MAGIRPSMPNVFLRLCDFSGFFFLLIRSYKYSSSDCDDEPFRCFPGQCVEKLVDGFDRRFRVLDAVARRQHAALPLLTGTVMRGEPGMQSVDAFQKSGRAQQFFPGKDKQVIR